MKRNKKKFDNVLIYLKKLKDEIVRLLLIHDLSFFFKQGYNFNNKTIV